MRGQHGTDHGAGAVRILHLGASGRLGRMVAAAWAAEPGLSVVPQWRRAGEAPPGAAIWSPLEEPVPDIGPVDVVVDLSGAVRLDVSVNAALAGAALDAAGRLGARWTLLPSSAAVYGAGPFGEAEDGRPLSDYGRSKREMERVAEGRRATCLRIGNVAGACALLGAGPGARVIDRLPDGRGPRRSYIGPGGLARVLAGLARLAAGGAALPSRLNVAAPGVVAMEALADAAGLMWRHRPAPEGVVAEVALVTGRLEALLPGAAGPADPEAMVGEWREHSS
jgi:nucleoside-diphosphate-sugar epimerase